MSFEVKLFCFSEVLLAYQLLWPIDVLVKRFLVGHIEHNICESDQTIRWNVVYWALTFKIVTSVLSHRLRISQNHAQTSNTHVVTSSARTLNTVLRLSGQSLWDFTSLVCATRLSGCVQVLVNRDQWISTFESFKLQLIVLATVEEISGWSFELGQVIDQGQTVILGPTQRLRCLVLAYTLPPFRLRVLISEIGNESNYLLMLKTDLSKVFKLLF